MCNTILPHERRRRPLLPHYCCSQPLALLSSASRGRHPAAHQFTQDPYRLGTLPRTLCIKVTAIRFNASASYPSAPSQDLSQSSQIVKATRTSPRVTSPAPFSIIPRQSALFHPVLQSHFHSTDIQLLQFPFHPSTDIEKSI